jgi:hypothetical protein
VLAGSRRRRIGKAGGSIKGGRIGLQEMVGMGQFENAINHSAGAGDAERAPGIFQAGKAIHNFSQTTTIELGHLRKVKDHARLTLLEKCIESQFQLLALRAHLERTCQLKNNDPWFQLFLNDMQGDLPCRTKILTVMTGSSQPQSAGAGMGSCLARIGCCWNFLGLVREFTNHADAIGESVEERVSPARGKDGGNFLVHVFVGLREEASKLSRRRSRKFPDGDQEADLAVLLVPFKRELVEKG